MLLVEQFLLGEALIRITLWSTCITYPYSIVQSYLLNKILIYFYRVAMRMVQRTHNLSILSVDVSILLFKYVDDVSNRVDSDT